MWRSKFFLFAVIISLVNSIDICDGKGGGRGGGGGGRGGGSRGGGGQESVSASAHDGRAAVVEPCLALVPVDPTKPSIMGSGRLGVRQVEALS